MNRQTVIYDSLQPEDHLVVVSDDGYVSIVAVEQAIDEMHPGVAPQIDLDVDGAIALVEALERFILR